MPKGGKVSERGGGMQVAMALDRMRREGNMGRAAPGSPMRASSLLTQALPSGYAKGGKVKSRGGKKRR